MAWIRCCVEEKEAMESCGRNEEEVGDEDGSSSGFGGLSASEAAMALEEREMPLCPPGLRQYETMVVLRPDMSEEERLALIQRLAPTYAVLPNGFDHLCSSLLLRAVRRCRDLASPLGTAKAGAGSATLSMAYATAKFADACLRGLRGDAGIVECSYIASQVTELPFFASKVRLGRSGVEGVLPLGPLNEFERSVEAAAAAAAAAGGTGRSPHGCCTSEVGCDLMVTLLFCSA